MRREADFVGGGVQARALPRGRGLLVFENVADRVVEAAAACEIVDLLTLLRVRRQGDEDAVQVSVEVARRRDRELEAGVAVRQIVE